MKKKSHYSPAIHHHNTRGLRDDTNIILLSERTRTPERCLITTHDIANTRLYE